MGAVLIHKVYNAWRGHGGEVRDAGGGGEGYIYKACSLGEEDNIVRKGTYAAYPSRTVTSLLV